MHYLCVSCTFFICFSAIVFACTANVLYRNVGCRKDDGDHGGDDGCVGRLAIVALFCNSNVALSSASFLAEMALIFFRSDNKIPASRFNALIIFRGLRRSISANCWTEPKMPPAGLPPSCSSATIPWLLAEKALIFLRSDNKVPASRFNALIIFSELRQ